MAPAKRPAPDVGGEGELHRFGSALQLNVHFYLLAPEGWAASPSRFS